MLALPEPPNKQAGSRKSRLRPSDKATSRTAISDNASNMSIDGHNHGLNPYIKAHNSEIKNECTICAALGRALGYCKEHLSANCPHCTEISLTFEQSNDKHKEEIDALRAKVKQLEKEILEERSAALFAEGYAEVARLQGQVDKVKKEDEKLKMDIKEQEKTLGDLEVDIKELQSAADFTFKEAKGEKK